MKITTKNPIDGSDLFWIDNSFAKNNQPGLNFEVLQKKHSLKYILNRGCGVLDAGAHIGDYGIPLAHALKNLNREDIIVYCIDPCPEKCQYMLDVIKLNKLSNIKVLNWGLSDDKSHYSICKQGRGGKESQGANSGTWQYKQDPKGSQFTTLDDLYDQNLIGPISFFWLDVQWMEINVLKGGIKYLSKYKPYILMEYWPVDSYLEDGVSVNHTARGTVCQLRQDPIFLDFFKISSIKIHEDQDPNFHDILLRFSDSN